MLRRILCAWLVALGLFSIAGCASEGEAPDPYARHEDPEGTTPGERHNGPQQGRAGEEQSW